ncbi:hypothetical protein L6452_22473 [Arctium lappa]|uniref:Uncharacterized protein n=1 Tax=Arctium lappa TaxID=4217 RepID=A0ACB9AZH5_ARCLA|nr:hypothetical protein L6452_22473 [Arctium lappa]
MRLEPRTSDVERISENWGKIYGQITIVLLILIFANLYWGFLIEFCLTEVFHQVGWSSSYRTKRGLKAVNELLVVVIWILIQRCHFQSYIDLLKGRVNHLSRKQLIFHIFPTMSLWN